VPLFTKHKRYLPSEYGTAHYHTVYEISMKLIINCQLYVALSVALFRTTYVKRNERKHIGRVKLINNIVKNLFYHLASLEKDIPLKDVFKIEIWKSV